MSSVLEEPGVKDPAHYARRVLWLALIHPALFATSLAGAVLLVWRGEFFVTLAQRSNVETLTIAFCILFFGYFAVLTAPGFLGGFRILGFHLRARLGSRERVERAKAKRLGVAHDVTAAAFDMVVELEGQRGSWDLELADSVGSVGTLRFDGVTVTHVDAFRGGSNTLFGYIQNRLAELTGADIEIVEWRSTDEEEFRKYRATAVALCALGAKLEADVWPRVMVTQVQKIQLERDLAQLCPALRDEAFLPDWEFEGEHKIPIIPEPLGIISLSRREGRVDPLTTLTTALVIVVLLVGVTCFFLARPPWLPGR